MSKSALVAVWILATIVLISVGFASFLAKAVREELVNAGTGAVIVLALVILGIFGKLMH